MAGEDLSKKDEALAYEEARRLRIAENNRRMQVSLRARESVEASVRTFWDWEYPWCSNTTDYTTLKV